MLAATAVFAYRGIRLTAAENEKLRAERSLRPRREHLLDVSHELKDIAAQVERMTPGGGYFDSSALAAHKNRLAVALDFFEDNELPRTRAAGLPHRRLYDCRHTCITWQLERDVPVAIVAALAGTSIQEISDTYHRPLAKKLDQFGSMVDSYSAVL